MTREFPPGYEWTPGPFIKDPIARVLFFGRAIKPTLASIPVALLVGLPLAGCGSTPTVPSGNAPTALGLVPDTMLIGAGDRGWFAALAGRDQGVPQTVTAATAFVSSNPAVLSLREKTVANEETVQLVSALEPGTTDVRASYQGLTATTHVTVFPQSAVRALAGYSTGGSMHSPCVPGETASFGVDALLDTGQRAAITAVTWRPVDPRILSVTTHEVFELSSGVVETQATVTCLTGGSTSVEAAYGVRTIRFDLTGQASR